MNILEVNDLNVYYGVIHAIKNISFHIKKGEIVSLIGANGAGKTSTLHAISGLVPIKSGEISLNGENTTNTVAHKLVSKGMAHVPEGRRIFSQLAVKDNLKLGQFTIKDSAEKKEEDRANFYKVFPRMSERKNQLAGTLSGGEQQMLAMGRALMSRPKLLILDEPSMGLSPLFVKEIFEVIKQLKEKGTTILLVEQNAKMALSISDRAYVIETGEIVLEGNAKDLLHNDRVKKAYLGG